MSVYQSVYVPSVGNVRALYMLPWILAVVVVNAFFGNASAKYWGFNRLPMAYMAGFVTAQVIY